MLRCADGSERKETSKELKEPKDTIDSKESKESKAISLSSVQLDFAELTLQSAKEGRRNQVQQLPFNRVAVLQDLTGNKSDYFDISLHFYESLEGEPIASIRDLSANKQFGFSPDFNVLFCLHSDGDIRAWDVSNVYKPRCFTKFHLKIKGTEEIGFLELAVISNTQIAISYYLSKKITIWDCITKKAVLEITEGVSGRPYPRLFSLSRQEKVGWIDADGLLHLFDVRSKQHVTKQLPSKYGCYIDVLPNETGGIFIHDKEFYFINLTQLEFSKIKFDTVMSSERFYILPTGELVTEVQSGCYTAWNIDNPEKPHAVFSFKDTQSKYKALDMSFLTKGSLVVSSDKTYVYKFTHPEKSQTRYLQRLSLFSQSINRERLQQLMKQPTIKVGSLQRQGVGRVC